MTKAQASTLYALLGIGCIVGAVAWLAGPPWALLTFGLLCLALGFALYEPPKTGGNRR